jgi:carbon monoxide dehydrogenase subunit G
VTGFKSLGVALCASLLLGAGVAGEAPPWVEVTAGGAGAAGRIRASVDIDAPPSVVWAVIIDPANAARLMAGARSCRVVERDPAGRWDVREQISKGGLLPGVRTVLRSDYWPDALIRFHQIGGDFKVLEGQWRLTPLDAGARTRVEYDSRVASPYPAPGPLVRAVLRRDMPQTLVNLREASEANVRASRP